MVRVISVHHFANQNIQTVEQPTACAVAPPGRLLLALTSNCVEVRDITNNADVLFSFPTVDEVALLLHCLNGDYVATMETKFNRQNRETNFVRVYVNWDSVATLQQSKMTSSGVSLGSSECGMVQPMRARIAGRVTPTTNQSELGSLEMIEIPVKTNPNWIACCQVSGNLAILAQTNITLHKFAVKTHDISKLRFIDFEEVPISIQLTFAPEKLELCENYVACMSKNSFHCFRIDCSANDSAEEFDFRTIDDQVVDYQALRGNAITCNLPSILRDNSIIHKNNPFTFSDKDMVATLPGNQTHMVANLIQLKLIPIVIESGAKSVTEEFKAMILKPLYIEESLNKPKDGDTFLGSDYRRSLNSVVCMVATQQEGYLYYFDDCGNSADKDNCIAIYPFTAPVHQLVMEDYFLHALTETGLESYTLRFGHQMCRNLDSSSDNVACPPITDSICLVGLRPFLGVERLLLAEHHLLLLANSDSSPTHSVSSNSSSNAAYWTLYNLELPTPKTIFNDISIVANVHRFTSAQTYCHLMSEAHMILRMALLLKKWAYTEDSVKLIIGNAAKLEEVVETYRTSCALLGDHFVMCANLEDYILAIPYYKMARVAPFDVLKRVKKIQEQSNNMSAKGLMHYLRHILLDVKVGQDINAGSKQTFTEAILDLLEVQGYQDLPNLILKSRIIREYSTDKLINILNKETGCDNPERLLALTVLYIQKCSSGRALECLGRIPNSSLFELLLENWELLLEWSQSPRLKGVATFSELAVLLISFDAELLSSILVNLIVDKKVVNLSKIIKVFLEYLPSSIGSDGNTASVVLQRTLEQYFENYFGRPENLDLTKIIYERGSSEAMKLLVRSYLSQLQILQLKGLRVRKMASLETSPPPVEQSVRPQFSYKKVDKFWFQEEVKKPNDPYLFSNARYDYLDKMPPFQIEITAKIREGEAQLPAEAELVSNPEAEQILKRLQALLCSQTVPKQVIGEVLVFLKVNEDLSGAHSLRSIILPPNDAVQLLIDVCPQSLPQFGKDRFTKRDEWKFLIATVQRRILKLSQQENTNRVCFFHKKILKDILTHVATSMTLENLVEVFPQRFSSETDKSDNRKQPSDHFTDDLDVLNEIQNYEPYVIICKETMHANQINKLITTTGQQLLCTLNL